MELPKEDMRMEKEKNRELTEDIMYDKDEDITDKLIDSMNDTK